MPPKKNDTALATVPPETEALNKQSTSIVSQAKAITVKDNASYAKASELISVGNELLKQVGETFDPLIAQAHKTHKALLSTKKQFTDPIEGALMAKKREMANYQMELEKERKAEEARLAEIAHKEAQERAVAEASLLAAQGEAEEAEQVIQDAIEAPAPTIVLPKFQSSDFGRQTRTVWKWKIIDLGKIPLHFLTVVENPATKLPQEVSTAAIGALVRTLKNKELSESQFKGGVEVFEDRTII
jgi:hypothetical protein